MTTKKKGAARMGRSEMAQVRFDPQLRFGLELAARAEKRTLSSYIEQVISKSLQDISVTYWTSESFLKTRTSSGDVMLAELIRKVWDTDELQRFLKLAEYAPSLLSQEDAIRWNFITKERSYWFKPAKSDKFKIFKPFLKAMWPHLREIHDEREYNWKLHAETLASLDLKVPDSLLDQYKKVVLELRKYYDAGLED